MDKSITELHTNFSSFDNWQDRYSYIIELGNSLPQMDSGTKTSINLIGGCVSNAWLTCKAKNGEVHFQADSDAHIVKGLLAIVLQICSKKTKYEIICIDFEHIFSVLGLSKNLTPSRGNGLLAVVQRIRQLLSKK
tara:strand:- start:1060 stop:1464 length:405 start_codon:yes stop_codon:yes gene_type:complete